MEWVVVDGWGGWLGEDGVGWGGGAWEDGGGVNGLGWGA